MQVKNDNEYDLYTNLNKAKRSLRKKLNELEISELEISDYNKRYLSRIKERLISFLDLYGNLIWISLNRQPNLSFDEIVLVDYGGGTGLISLLAKEIGIKRVIYNDIYNVSCNDFRILSKSLGYTINDIVCGDVEDLVEYTKVHSIQIDAVISFDVLEHIYDVDKHFETLSKAGDNAFRIVYGSGANPLNPLFVYRVKKKHHEHEYEGKERQWGHKKRDSVKPYLEIRKKIISEYSPDLESEDLELLASATRGLIKQDIEKCVNEYKQHGHITYTPDHSTNTCDPLTGNWSEHLIDLKWLKNIIEEYGFQVKIYPGFYMVSGNWLKKSVELVLNAVIRIFGQNSMMIAHHYIVCADKISSEDNLKVSK